MPTTFASRITRNDVFDVVVSRIEAGEADRRKADAVQLLQLAEAFRAAAAGTGVHGTHGTLPGRESQELAYRAIRAEIACALHLSEQTVERRMSHAVSLTTLYSATLAALHEGKICLQHTHVIADAGEIIGSDDTPTSRSRRAAYEAAILEVAADTTPGRLRPIARRLAEQYAEAPLENRHEKARTKRGVFLVDREDGMTDLVAHLPSVEAHSIFDRITRMSRLIAHEQAEPSQGDDAPQTRRSRSEIRADLFTELLLKSDPDIIIENSRCGVTGIQAHVQVTITDTALWNSLSDQLKGTSRNNGGELDGSEFYEAFLAGCGPISESAANEVAANADRWHLVTTDHDNGAVLAVETYRPSAHMRRLLSARDEHCRFPGCRAPVQRCDIDHTIDAQYGGPTSTTNLAHLCRGHHTLKHHGGWRVKQKESGVLEWWSPAGRKYLDRPPSTVRFKAINISQFDPPPLDLPQFPF